MPDTTDPKPSLFPSATVRGIRVAAQDCRDLAKTTERWDDPEADNVHYFLEDMGGWPYAAWGAFTSWTDTARMLEAEADRLDPPPPRVVLYTTAGLEYSGFSVVELDANAGTDNRGKVVRKVSVEQRDLIWYQARCGSGLHATATEDEVERFSRIWKLKGV